MVIQCQFMNLNFVIFSEAHKLCNPHHPSFLDLLPIYLGFCNTMKNLLAIHLKLKFRLPITPVMIYESFWNFAQSMAVWLPCSVHNFRRIHWLKWKIWANEILWDFQLKKDLGWIAYNITEPYFLFTSPRPYTLVPFSLWCEFCGIPGLSLFCWNNTGECVYQY